MKKFIIEKEYKGYTVAKYLKEVQHFSSRSMRNMKFILDNKEVRSDKKIKPLNRLQVIEKNKGTNIEPIAMDLDIVYEDSELLIINKEPFIVVHPTLKKVDKTLAHGIVHYFLEKTGNITVPRFYNRLDMNTSGLIVITKTAFAQAFLQDKVDVKKKYLAIVKGVVEKDEFIIEEPIGRVGESLRREILSIEKGGQEAKTAVKVLKRFEDYTLIECELFTGRTHQIRVHLSTMGHPIMGDELYDGLDLRAKRQLLHAYKLKLVNPKTKEIQEFEAELPTDIKKLINN
ncbi:MAG: RluA family pseudouridine synthase [Fusobacteriaceae bacterium]|jgi:23S rRNA pseudouridine1911/1915/1917 synthase|nr:RluA family pseudouridine synthase [Fusobacteriaceae bacterium]MBP6467584.1 RluA family pseudouridine synthase [Fusobacteriaceae bacterium]MBU9917975.1 RluA family pseudouridine synthase [Fusobacteriaceae bacterium]